MDESLTDPVVIEAERIVRVARILHEVRWPYDDDDDEADTGRQR